MKNQRVRLGILTLLTVFFASCTAIYENGNELARVAKAHVSEIPVDTLKAMIENGEEYLLIDVRQPAEYDAGNITGSFSIPRGELEFLITDEMFWEEQFMYLPQKSDKIIVYCKVGDRGILAAKALQRIGFSNVYNLEGGYTAFAGDVAASTVKVDAGGCGG